ncbi:MAG: hypothetical protein WCF90_11080 [Methanomicrobiales archaeon]
MDKLRLTLVVATEAQITSCPSLFWNMVGPFGLGMAHVMSPEPGLVFASSDPVAAEVFALALLRNLKQSVPFFPRLSERIVLYQNKNEQDFTATPVRNISASGMRW